jgi:hypothetical protein
VDSVAAAALNGQANHFLDALVAFVVVEGDDLAVTIDADKEWVAHALHAFAWMVLWFDFPAAPLRISRSRVVS